MSHKRLVSCELSSPVELLHQDCVPSLLHEILLLGLLVHRLHYHPHLLLETLELPLAIDYDQSLDLDVELMLP